MPGADLDAATLAPHLGARPLRAYPAVLSTEADALAWARAGAPAGALVTAGYQASPRGRGGFPWNAQPDRSLGFSLMLRPGPGTGREGWPYLAAATGLAETLGAAGFAWPDAVGPGEGGLVGRIAVQCADAPAPEGWVVVSCLIEGARPPRGPLLAEAASALESWAARPDAEVLAAARARCATLGQRVRARMVPLGPRSAVVEGLAVDLDGAGSLVVEGADGRRRALRPDAVGTLEDTGQNAR